MDTKRIGGQNGIDISVVGMGCNAFGRRLDYETSRPVIHAAFDTGINFFDTAEAYGDGLSEEFIGRAIKGRRDQVFLATKFGLRTLHVPGKGKGSRDNAMVAIDMSLKRLGTDHIDLYQLHMPDPSTPIAETLEAMNDMVKAGKVRLIGCSNFSAVQMREAIDTAKSMGLDCFVTAQNEWSVLERDIEDELMPVCADNSIGILPYYPLAKGLLTGKYRRGEAAPSGSRLEGASDFRTANFDVLEALENFATSRGFNLLTLGVSWLISQATVVSVISGVSRVDQLAQNVAAADWKMTADDLTEIDRIVRQA